MEGELVHRLHSSMQISKICGCASTNCFNRLSQYWLELSIPIGSIKSYRYKKQPYLKTDWQVVHGSQKCIICNTGNVGCCIWNLLLFLSGLSGQLQMEYITLIILKVIEWSNELRGVVHPIEVRTSKRAANDGYISHSGWTKWKRSKWSTYSRIL